jgi:N-methylhydantoinase B
MMRREMSSMMGSTTVAEQRMIELLDKYGKETVLASIEEMIERTEKAVRAIISAWPEGTYSTEVRTDDDGSTMGRPIHVRCTLTIKNGELTFDFSETDDQVTGMINSYYHQTLSNVLCTTFLFLGKDLAAYHNEGSMRPIHVVTRKGTIVDCKPGALVAGAPAVTGSLVIEAVLSLLSQAIPERAITPYSRLVSPLIVGNNQQTNQLYVYTSFCSAGGAGAVMGYDGYQCVCDMGTLGVVGKTDAEEEMARFPWDINQYEFRTDSHGAGKWRGSPGIIWEGVNEGGKCNFIGGPWSGFSTQAEGQQGGEATPLNRAYIIRDGTKIEITQPHLPLELKPGDHLVTLSGGGAGIGKPEAREPEAVRTDVRNELVSVEMARNVYKVMINSKTYEIDHRATAKLRGSK